MASNAVNGCPSIRVIIQQCLSAKLQVQPPTEDSDAQWVEVRNEINSGGPIIQTLREEGGLALAPWAQLSLKIGWDHMLPSSTPPPPSFRCATDKKKPVHRIYAAQPLAYQGQKYTSCLRSLNDPDHIYTSPQKNEIAKSEVVRVALNKRTPAVEKGRRLLGVFGSGRQGVKQAANPDQQFLTNSTLFPPSHINLLNNCRKTQIILLRRPS